MARLFPDCRSLFARSLVLTLLLLTPFLLNGEELPVRALKNLGIPNWAGNDYAPQISPDGRFLIFQSDRPGDQEDHNLWYSINRNYADRLGDPEWTTPLPLQFPLVGKPTRTMAALDRGGPAGTGRDDDRGAFRLNTDGFEGMPSLVYRKDRPVEIYFTSLRGDATGRDGFDGLNIYFSRFRDGRWSPPEHLNVINSDFNDRIPVVSTDGKQMYFASDRPGGYGGYDIWYSERDLRTGRWARPVNAGASWNTEFHENAPALSPGGDLIVFSSDRPGGFGHYDLYFSRFDGDAWTRPENLGAPFNSSHDDETISFTGDGLWAYFASDRRFEGARGDFDIYRVGLPERMRFPGQVLFTGQVIDARSRKLLGVEATFHVLYEKRTEVHTSRVFLKDPGDKDINNFAIQLDTGREYRVKISAPGFHPQELVLDYKGNVPDNRIDRRTILLQPIVPDRPGQGEDLRMLPGVVLDHATDKLIENAEVEYMLDGKSYTAEVRAGRFKVAVGDGRTFDLFARAPGYYNYQNRFTASPDLRELIVRMKKIPEEGPPCPDNRKPECLNSLRLLFDYDESQFRAGQDDVLEAVVRILKANPELRLEIRGHTDKRGTLIYNQRLSEARAETVKRDLIKRGADPENLKSVGYNFSQPVDTAETDEARARNRRVDFRVRAAGVAPDETKPAKKDEQAKPDSTGAGTKPAMKAEKAGAKKAEKAEMKKGEKAGADSDGDGARPTMESKKSPEEMEKGEAAEKAPADEAAAP